MVVDKVSDMPDILSICCTPPPPDIDSLLPAERQRFGKLVHELHKQGYDLQSAQTRAYSQILNESVPYDHQ